MTGLSVGFAMCGSFCTFSKVIPQISNLVQAGYNVFPIMSEAARQKDTRFGKAQDFVEKVETICSHKLIGSICEAEPIGPKKMADILVVAPCTSNTLSKLSNAITDTTVTMAVKSHLRIGRPVLIALATNDALGASAQNIGKMINNKNIYFVPLHQDDPEHKPIRWLQNLICLYLQWS